MKRRILSIILAMVMIFSLGESVFASYGYNSSYSGENYLNYNYNNNYYGSFYMSSWAKDLEMAYEPTWYESPQRQVTRGEAFLVFLRAVQRSLDRQGYSRLMSGYVRVPFTDYNTVNTYAQGEVNVLYANNILVGYDDNTMKFAKLLTRAEMAAIYSRFNRIYFNMGMGYNQLDYDGYNNYYNNNYNNYYNNYVFSDITGHWAAQDIITAASNGVVNGVGYNIFNPEGPLTIEEIWTFLDRCVGYQGLKRSDIAYAMTQTFKVKFGKNIDESYGTSGGTKITRLSAQSTTVSIREGETKNIKVTISPTKASYQKLQWSFENYSDTNYATIDEAWNSSSGTAYVRVYGKRASNSYLTLTGRAMDGSGKKVSVRVKITNGYDYDDDYDYEDGYITSITPSESVVYLNIGESVKLNARISPSDADYKDLSWSSSNTNIADVSDEYLSGSYSYATVTGNREGIAYIYIKAQDGSGEQETVKVVVSDDYQEPDIDISSATATPSVLDMNVGDTDTVSIKIYPTNATDKNITWMSENENIATVYKLSKTSIRITAIREGTTNIVGIADATGEEVCIIPVTVESNKVYDKIAPEVQITGATVIKRDQIATIVVEAYDDNLDSFELRKSDILGMTGAGVSVHNIRKISKTKYEVDLLGVEVSIGEVCIAAGVAVDTAGNYSEETDGVVIKVLAID